MDNRKIDQDVYERYVDATVALFMEYYSAERAEDMHNELSGNEKIEVELPAELDNRCRTLIKKEHARRKRKEHMKTAMKGLRFVACFAVIVLALASVLFVSVEAIRVPIINYYITQSDKYLEITSRKPSADGSVVQFNAEDPLAGLLPEGYKLVVVDKMSPTQTTAVYKTSDKNSISFTMYPSETVARVDSENAQAIKEICICGYDGFLVAKGDRITITWWRESNNQTFSIISTSLTESELITLAETFIQSMP